MAYVCDNCGKKISVGRSQRHGRGVAGKRWRKRAQVTVRTFKPNLQKVSILLNGKRVQMRLCAKCLKKFKKERKIQSYTNVAFG